MIRGRDVDSYGAPATSCNTDFFSTNVYKRLPPSEIVRLAAGDEIIVVLPPITSKTSATASSIIGRYRRGFSGVLDRTLRAVDPSSRTALVDDAIRSRHTFLRSHADFWEFECRVKSYPIRELLESEYSDESMIHTNWDQGAGFDVSVCGYTIQHTILLKLRDVAFLQFYRRCTPECFINDGIAFNHRVQDGSKLDGPLVDQLSLFDGCAHSTLEILWKYYRALHLVGKKKSSRPAVPMVDAAVAEVCAAVGDDRESDHRARDGMVAIVAEELCSDNVEQFVSVVDSVYGSSFESHYSGFTSNNGYLVERRLIRKMYVEMKTLFPFIHSVISMTVCNPRGERIQLFEPVPSLSPGSDATAIPDPDVDLSKRERAVLEFFTAQIRLRSQKAMVQWAMVPPLASHSWGSNVRNPTNHPLQGAGCHIETVWHRLNKLYDDSLVGNSVFGFRFLGRPEFGVPLPSSEFRNFPAENQIGKPENRSSQKSEFRFRFFRNSGIPLITYIGTQYFLIL